MARNSVSQKNCFITHHIANHHTFQEHILWGAAGYGCIVNTRKSISPYCLLPCLSCNAWGHRYQTNTGWPAWLQQTGWVGTAVPPLEKAICVQHQHLTMCQTGTGPLKQSKSTHLPAFTGKVFCKLSHAWPLTEIVILELLLESLSIALLPVTIDIGSFFRCFIPRFAENFSVLCNVDLICSYSKLPS